MTQTRTQTTQVYRVWIKATPEAVWDAITSPEWTDRYGYGGLPEYGDLTPGNRYRINPGKGMQAAGIEGPIIDGELLEVDPPRRFVQTWRMLMDPGLEAEGFTRLAYDIQASDGGVTRLTVTHDLADAPALASMVAGESESAGAGGGWAWILSDLKSLLETGSPLVPAA
ncbi:MAG: SRPBCC domain-containing protein [Actinomycetota bacterium]|nr:SRPBCC domain-containing protein [Actinomycetota bacterium]